MFEWFKRFADWWMNPPSLEANEENPSEDGRQVVSYLDEINQFLSSEVTNEVYRDVSRLPVVIYNIEDYCWRLTQAQHALFEDSVFPEIEFEFKQIRRCHFYRNGEGGYIDAVKRHEKFVTQAVALLRHHELIMQQRLDGQPLSSKLSTSLRRMNPMIDNLRAMAAYL